MQSQNRRDEKKVSRNLPVTSKCLAIVLSDNETSVGDNLSRSLINRVHNGKELLEDFKLRNKMCYWNPALVESIKSLCYKGFVEPSTILVVGNEIHLENLRTAWGRRVLKAPCGFTIERIGDVNGIEMQVIPQTQFIPLPDALCLITMDLNNKCIVATLDTIKEKLVEWYKEMTMPNDQLIFHTLGCLIQQRKIFHSGNGYFVVTPETYHCSTDDNKISFNTSWLPYHPMYIPVFPQIQELPSALYRLQQQEHQHHHHFHQQHKQAVMRSISCQADVPSGVKSKDEWCKIENVKEAIKARPRSLSIRESRSKKQQERMFASGESTLKRTTSLKNGKEKDMKDNKLKDSNINNEREKGDKEKMSIFARLFNRNKKKKLPIVTPSSSGKVVKGVEYASFSAQFPPPEWHWYKHQIEKQRRTQEWVCDQVSKSCSSQYFPMKYEKKRQGRKHVHRIKREENSVRQQISPDEQILCVIEDLPLPVLADNEDLYQSVNEKRTFGPSHSTPRFYETIPTQVDKKVKHNTMLKPVSVYPSHNQKLSQRQKQRSHQNDITLEFMGNMPNEESSCMKSRDSGVNCVSFPGDCTLKMSNDLKTVKHCINPEVVRNKLDNISEHKNLSHDEQLKAMGMSDDQIETGCQAAGSNNFQSIYKDSNRKQLQSDVELDENMIPKLVIDKVLQEENIQGNIQHQICVSCRNLDTVSAVQNKDKEFQNQSHKISKCASKDTHTKLVDSGFSSPHCVESKNCVNCKYKTNSERKANFEGNFSNQVSAGQTQKNLSNNIQSGNGSLLQKTDKHSKCSNDLEVFQQQQLCVKQFGVQGEYQVVGVL